MEPLGRLHIITGSHAVAQAALTAGARMIQVRVTEATTDREAYELTGRIRELCRSYGATCLVNDRLDVALATGADGAHVGEHDLPVEAARRVLGPRAVLGVTARDPTAARAAHAAGASYLGVGPAYATTSKDGLPTAIGPKGVGVVVAAVPELPVIAIGGVTADGVSALQSAGAYGVAVIGAVDNAADPVVATGSLLAALAEPVESRT